jgi:hypothetical protein
VRSAYLRGVAALVAVAGAAFVSGCGASRTVSQALDPVARAADVTSNVQGFKVAADMTVGTPQGQVKVVMSGAVGRLTSRRS